MSRITIERIRPGVSAETNLNVTPTEAKHYAQLVGCRINEILFVECEGQPLPILVLDNGKQVSVLCDPEGNGPGHLSID